MDIDIRTQNAWKICQIVGIARAVADINGNGYIKDELDKIIEISDSLEL